MNAKCARVGGWKRRHALSAGEPSAPDATFRLFLPCPDDLLRPKHCDQFGRWPDPSPLPLVSRWTFWWPFSAQANSPSSRGAEMNRANLASSTQIRQTSARESRLLTTTVPWSSHVPHVRLVVPVIAERVRSRSVAYLLLKPKPESLQARPEAGSQGTGRHPAALEPSHSHPSLSGPSLLSDDDPSPDERRLHLSRSVGRTESGRAAEPRAGRVGRSGVLTPIFRRRAARGGSVGRVYHSILADVTRDYTPRPWSRSARPITPVKLSICGASRNPPGRVG